MDHEKDHAKKTNGLHGKKNSADSFLKKQFFVQLVAHGRLNRAKGGQT